MRSFVPALLLLAFAASVTPAHAAPALWERAKKFHDAGGCKKEGRVSIGGGATAVCTKAPDGTLGIFAMYEEKDPARVLGSLHSPLPRNEVGIHWCHPVLGAALDIPGRQYSQNWSLIEPADEALVVSIERKPRVATTFVSRTRHVPAEGYLTPTECATTYGDALTQAIEQGFPGVTFTHWRYVGVYPPAVAAARERMAAPEADTVAGRLRQQADASRVRDSLCDPYAPPDRVAERAKMPEMFERWVFHKSCRGLAPEVDGLESQAASLADAEAWDTPKLIFEWQRRRSGVETNPRGAEGAARQEILRILLPRLDAEVLALPPDRPYTRAGLCAARRSLRRVYADYESELALPCPDIAALARPLLPPFTAADPKHAAILPSLVFLGGAVAKDLVWNAPGRAALEVSPPEFVSSYSQIMDWVVEREVSTGPAVPDNSRLIYELQRELAVVDQTIASLQHALSQSRGRVVACGGNSECISQTSFEAMQDEASRAGIRASLGPIESRRAEIEAELTKLGAFAYKPPPTVTERWVQRPSGLVRWRAAWRQRVTLRFDDGLTLAEWADGAAYSDTNAPDRNRVAKPEDRVVTLAVQRLLTRAAVMTAQAAVDAQQHPVERAWMRVLLQDDRAPNQERGHWGSYFDAVHNRR